MKKASELFDGSNHDLIPAQFPPQEKTISDLWRIAQKKNCDDFIKIVKELKIKIIYQG